MSRYEVFLLIHVVAAIAWLGGGLVLQIQGIRADRAKDADGLRKVLEDVVSLSNLFFVPAALLVVIFGIAMVADGPWTFGQLWIVLGLAGYAATFATGLFLLDPRSKRILAMMEEEAMSPRVVADVRRLLALSRIDYAVLYSVVAVMVLKPTGDDVGILAVLGAIVAGTAVWAVRRARSVAAAEPSATA
ncbi:MAG TPA: DUF2269 family protein [Gaiellaceae bacterium]|nr:DUF2269 family protein [Gaiellaceae bacterium]